MRLRQENKSGVVFALGISQTIAWASSYYLPAVLAAPAAQELGISPVRFFAAFSAALVLSATLGPWCDARIDRFGGRGVLVWANIVFAAGLALLGLCTGQVSMFAAWLLIGVGMGIGLYDSAFAALATIYGGEARTAITGITLLAGFASTIGWPLSAGMEAHFGWRGACFGWAALHIFLALPLNALLPKGIYLQPKTKEQAKEEIQEKTQERLKKKADSAPSNSEFWELSILAFVFAITCFSSTAMAVHLPRLLQETGASSIAAVAAGALMGPAQVMARVFEFAFLSRVHPLISTRLAVLAHPLGAVILMVIGAPAAAAFTILHGAGNGMLTIAKGTLPLTLFGSVGYGLRQGIISFPARILQAFAPLIFGFALELYGKNAIWLNISLSLLAFAALLALRIRPVKAG